MSTNKPANFDDVALDSYEEAECSPSFEDSPEDVRGIRVNAPAQARVAFEGGWISPSSRIPLCVALQFPGSFFVEIGDVHSRITVVMVDRRTGRSYSGNLAMSRPGRPGRKNPSIPPSVLASSTLRKFVNVNLVNYLQLPAVKTVYDLYATIEDEKSNSLTIEIR